MFRPENPSARPPVETAGVGGRRRLEFPLLLAAAFISALLAGPIILANPTGGVVVRGNADIETLPKQVTVDQHSDKAVIDWDGFSIETGEVTRFDQPGKDSIALNRVITNRPSDINGRLEANGNVWLINQNGVTVGPGGKVHTQGFLATTADIADDNFMRGNYNFDRPSANPDAKVINRGHISVGERGLGALVAPHARNDGVIRGQASTLVIAGTKTFAVDFYGDGLIHFDTGSPVTQRPEGVDALAENNGRIQTQGGQVLITADAAAGIIDKVIKIGGKVARRAFVEGDVIVLDGGRSGTVAVAGTLDASSAQRSGQGGHGGKIDVRGREIEVGPKALITAEGKAGGGDIRIGARGRGGKGPGRNADVVVLDSEARIIADATISGDGGEIIVYGERTALIDGTLTARGGPRGGDGGFIETSAAGTIEIAADTLVDASAPAGKPGTWLIDPTDITIVSALTSTGANQVLASSIVTALQGGNDVTIATTDTAPIARPPGHPSVTGDSAAGDGDITVEASIRPNLAGATGDQVVTLTLTAHNNVEIKGGVTIGVEPTGISGGDGMGVKIDAGGNITNKGTIKVSAGSGGNVAVCQGVCLTAASSVALGRIDAGTRNITVTATNGAISDNWGDEGKDNENLVGGAIKLTAGTGIGTYQDPGDIDTNAGSIEATTTSGDVAIAETGAVQLGNKKPVPSNTTEVLITPGTGGSIQVTSGQEMTVAQNVSTTGNGEIHLQATNSDLTVNPGVTIETADGEIRLEADNLTIEDDDPATTATAEIVAGGGKDIVFLTDQSIGLGLGGTGAEFRLDQTEIAALETDGFVRFGTDAERVGNVVIDTANFGSVGGLEIFSDGSIRDTGGVWGSKQVHLQAKILRFNLETNQSNIDAMIGTDKDQPLNTAAAIISATTDATNTADSSIYIDNALASDVTVISLTSGGTGDIRFDQSGGGAVDFGTVTTNNGAVTLTNTGAGLTVTKPIEAGGSDKDLTLKTTGSGDITLTGTTTAADDKVEIDSAGAINGGGVVTAKTVDLDAATGIGSATGLKLAAANISADTKNGDIDIGNTLGSDVAVTSLTSGGTGDIQFDQSGGGAVNFGTVTTNDGAVTLTNTNAGLAVTGPIVVGGSDKDLTLKTTGSGDITLTGTTTATPDDKFPDEKVQITSAGAINGGGVVTAKTVDLDAATGIGSATGLKLAAANISADTKNGDIDIGNTLGSDVAVTSLTSGGTGDIQFDQSGGGAVNFGTVTTNDGAVTLTNAGAELIVTGRINAGSTGKDLKLTTSESSPGSCSGSSCNITLTGATTATSGKAQIDSAGAISGGGLVTATTADLDAATGISALELAAASISADTDNGGIDIDNTLGSDVTVTSLTSGGSGSIQFDQAGGGAVKFGTVITSNAVTTNNGAVTLTNAGAELTVTGPIVVGGSGRNLTLTTTGSGDIILSKTTTAADDEVKIDSAGAIDGGGLVTAKTVDLDAATGIGNAIALKLAAASVSADTTNGKINIDNTPDSKVTVTSLTSTNSTGTATGDIQFNQSGGKAVEFATVTTNDGAVALNNTGAELTVNEPIAAGGTGKDLNLTTVGSGDITLTGTTTATGDEVQIASAGAVNGMGLVTADTVDLDAATGIGENRNPLNTAAAIISADTDDGGIYIDNTSNSDVTVTSLTSANSTDTATGNIQFEQSGGGAVDFAGVTTDDGTITLTNTGAGLTVTKPVEAGGSDKNLNLTASGSGDITVRAGGSVVNDQGQVQLDADTGTVRLETGLPPGFVRATIARITAADIDFQLGSQVEADKIFFLAPTERNLGLGGAAGDFRVSDEEIKVLNTGTVQFGNGTKRYGSILIDTADFTTRNVTLFSNKSINDTDTTPPGSTSVHLQAGIVQLDAGTGVGDDGNPLDTATASISAATADRGIYIDNTLGSDVAVTSLTSTNPTGSATGEIRFDQSGGGAVDFAAVTTDNGDVTLTNDLAGITLSGPITAGGTSTARITATADAINGSGLVTSATVDLNAATGIGNTEALELAAARISADTKNGGIDLDNTLDSAVIVTSLTSTNPARSATGDIRFDQAGGGAVDFKTVTTNDGAVTLTNTDADPTNAEPALSVTGLIEAGGSGKNIYLTTSVSSGGSCSGVSCDIDLTETTTARDDQVQINSAGAINGMGLVTGDTVDLDAATGIGSTTALKLAAASIRADTKDGGIDIDNTLASKVTVTSLTSSNSTGSATGDIQFDQSGGGAVDFKTVTTNDGAVTLTNTDADPTNAEPALSVTGLIEAGGSGKNIYLTTSVSSGGSCSGVSCDIDLTETTTATGDQVQINSAGAINGMGLVTGDTVDLDAATGIGSTTALKLAAASISADTKNGGIDIDNTLDSKVTVTSLTSSNSAGSATSDIQFDQSGGGAVNFGTATTSNAVTTNDGAVTLTNTDADPTNAEPALSVTGLIEAGGSGKNIYLTTSVSSGGSCSGVSCDIDLTGATTARDDQVQITSAGAINGSGLVTAKTVDLDAATGIGIGIGIGIGSTTALELAAARISADTADGGIDIDNALASDVTVTSLTSGGTGNIQFNQRGGGTVDFETLTTDDGEVTLTNTGAGLSVTGLIVAGGSGRNLTLTTTGSGDITLTGTTTAADDQVQIVSAGAIDGMGLVAAETVDLDAATGIGSATGLKLAAANISADTKNGDIDIGNTLGSAVIVTSLTSTNPTGSATGDIRFDQTGGGAVDFARVTTDNGTITLTNTDAKLGVTGSIEAGGSGKDLKLTTSESKPDSCSGPNSCDITLTGTTTAADDQVQIVSAGAIQGMGLVTAKTLDLDAATGVGDNGNPLNTAVDNIEAQTSGGSIFIEETDGVALDRIVASAGAISVEVGSATTHHAALGRIVAGTGKDITITVGGAITDKTPTDDGGPAHENLVGGAIRLIAGAGIGAGAPETADIDTQAVSLDASAGGEIFIDETDDLAVGRIDAGSNAITVKAGGAITDGNAKVKADGREEENLVGGTIHLTAGAGIGAGAPETADIDTQAVRLDVQTSTGDIFLDETDGVALDRIVASAGAISVEVGDATAPDATTHNAFLGRIVAGTANDRKNITITAGGAITDANGEVQGEENLVGRNIRLTAGGGEVDGEVVGIGATGNADIDTQAVRLDVQTSTGDIFLDETDGVALDRIVASAGAISVEVGDATTHHAALGRLMAGTDTDREDITITAGGAITDGSDGSEEENLVGRNIRLTAGGGEVAGKVVGIGEAGDADIDTKVVSIDAQTTTSGGIFIAETDGVQLGKLAAVTAPGAIKVTTGKLLEVNQAVRAGGNVILTGGAGITHTAAGDITSIQGAITAEATGGDISMANGTVYRATAKDTGGATLTAQGNVELGRIEAGANAITVIADNDENGTGAISDNNSGVKSDGKSEEENLVGGAVRLTAGSGIGTSETDIDTNVDSIDARTTTSGGIFIDETDGVQLGKLAAVTAPGAIEVTTGKLLEVNQAVRAGGNVILTGGTGITHTAAGDVTSTGGTITAEAKDNDILMTDGTIYSAIAKDSGGATLTARGNVALGRIEAGANAITVIADSDENGTGAISDNNSGVESDGKSEEENLVGGAVRLTAGSGIGTSETDIDTNADSIDARTTTSGGIFIDETDGVQLGKLAAVTAPGAIEVTTGKLLEVNQAVRAGGNVILTGGAGITHTAAGDVTSTQGAITAKATSGDIRMADGTIYSATAKDSGGAALTAQGNVALGRIEAGANAITVIADSDEDGTGAISDITGAEGRNNENLVGGAISLTAGSGIGAAGEAADIDTAADTIDAATKSGGIYLAEADGVQLGKTASVTTGSGGGSIEVTAGGKITVAQAVTTAGDGKIGLTTRAGNLEVEAAVTAGGELDLDAADLLILAAAVSGRSVELSGGAGIRHTPDGDVTSIDTISMVSANDITMADGTVYTSIEGNVTFMAQRDVNLGRIVANAGDIIVTAKTGAIRDITAPPRPVGSRPGGDGGVGDENLVGKAITLVAATGIGVQGAPDIDTAAEKIDARIVNTLDPENPVGTAGGIFIDETDGVQLGGEEDNATITAGAKGGSIEITSGGPMTVARNVTTKGGGEIRLTTAAGGLQVNQGVTADGALNLNAADRLNIAAAVGGSSVVLTGGAGIEHGDAGDVTAGGTLTATATTGDIGMADGILYGAGGAVRLGAQGNVGLGRIQAGGNSIAITAGGAIRDNTAAEGAGSENLVGGDIRLTAASGIGASGEAADIDTAANTIDATTGLGGIYLAETDVVQLGNTASVTTGSGAIQVSAGGAMTVAQAVTTAGSGAISLTTRADDLRVNAGVTAGSELRLDAAGRLNIAAPVSGSSINLSGGTGIGHTAAGDVTSRGAITATARAGDIGMADGALYNAGGAVSLTARNNVGLGRIQAGSNSITVTATGGKISDNTAAEGAGSENLVGSDIELTAGSGIGAAGEIADIDTTVNTIDATTGSGGIYLAETDVVQLGKTGSVTTGSGGGSIEITAGDTMTVAQAVTTAGSGAISLTTKAGDLRVNAGVTAGGELDLDAANLLSLAAAVSGSSVELTGGKGITHTAAGDVESGGILTVTAKTNDILMADGALYEVAGETTLTARRDIQLGRIQAGANSIKVTATEGKISDNTAAEGAGNENLVGSDIELTAATGIGAPGEAADIDTAASTINARTTRSGGIYLAETDAVTLAPTTVPEVLKTGIRAAAGADIEITAGGEMTVGKGGVSTSSEGDILLTTTSGNLIVGGLVETGSGDLEVCADKASIRHSDGGLLQTTTDKGTLALFSGGAIGEKGAPILIDVGTVAAKAENGGVFLKQGSTLRIGKSAGAKSLIGITATGNIEVTTVGPDSDLFIYEKIEPGKRGAIELEVGGRIIAKTEHLRGFRYQETIDSTLQLTRGFFDNLAEAYAIPDYAVDEELNLVYLSGANEAIWGWNKRYDDEEEDEEE